MTPPFTLVKSDTRTFIERLADYHQDALAVHRSNAQRRDTTTCVLAYGAGRVAAATQLLDMAHTLGTDAFGLYLLAYGHAADAQHERDLEGTPTPEARAYNAGKAEAALEIRELLDQARDDRAEDVTCQP